MAQESGYSGELVSLGGVRGIRFRGRQCDSATYTLVTGDNQSVLVENGRRISAIIQNVDDVDAVDVRLGDGPVFVRIYPHGSLQIDSDFPWTGYVYGQAVANTPTVRVFEVSVP